MINDIEWVKDRVSLYLYNELSEEERERFESLVDSDPSCAAALEIEKRFLQSLNVRSDDEVDAAFLSECRHDLSRTVYREDQQRPRGLTAWFAGAWAMVTEPQGSWTWAVQSGAALSLVAVGFWAGRVSGPEQMPILADAQPAVTDIAPASLSNIEEIRVDPGQQRVEFVLEEVNRRRVTGPARDPEVEQLLLTALEHYPNPGVRLELMDALAPRSEEAMIRAALVRAMREDPNPGIRLRALTSLRDHATAPDVRAGLLSVLRDEQNPGMRVEAINLLTAHPDRGMVGYLQDVLRHERAKGPEEQNRFVLVKCSEMLQELNASVDHF